MLSWFRSESRLLWVIVALVLAAGWSTTGLVFRLIEEAGALEVVFYRSLGLASAITSFVVFRYRINTLRAFRAIGWPGVIGGAGLGFASIAFIMAIERTTIANISFLVATAPFFVGALAWIVMREPMGRRTALASAIAMAGVALMVWEGFAGGSWEGNLLALACSLLASFYIVACRFGRGRDMVPSVAVSGMMACAAAALTADHLSISFHDLALCIIQGIFISAVCNGLFTLAARHLPAAELTVLSMVESVLSPFWVFLFLAEIPTLLTIIGGIIILAAISFQAFLPARDRSRDDTAPSVTRMKRRSESP
ncbi:MAG: DMT family transporter [bacterium]|nr:DMT family transporter [bacterium]MDE0242608.1 DMT family transporter [bacterium]MDE0419099.1 DMT family transporter [bacterium]